MTTMTIPIFGAHPVPHRPRARHPAGIISAAMEDAAVLCSATRTAVTFTLNQDNPAGNPFFFGPIRQGNEIHSPTEMDWPGDVEGRTPPR
jgi:hypothetical protein